MWNETTEKLIRYFFLPYGCIQSNSLLQMTCKVGVRELSLCHYPVLQLSLRKKLPRFHARIFLNVWKWIYPEGLLQALLCYLCAKSTSARWCDVTWKKDKKMKHTFANVKSIQPLYDLPNLVWNYNILRICNFNIPIINHLNISNFYWKAYKNNMSMISWKDKYWQNRSNFEWINLALQSSLSINMYGSQPSWCHNKRYCMRGVLCGRLLSTREPTGIDLKFSWKNS